MPPPSAATATTRRRRALCALLLCGCAPLLAAAARRDAAVPGGPREGEESHAQRQRRRRRQRAEETNGGERQRQQQQAAAAAKKKTAEEEERTEQAKLQKQNLKYQLQAPAPPLRTKKKDRARVQRQKKRARKAARREVRKTLQRINKNIRRRQRRWRKLNPPPPPIQVSAREETMADEFIAEMYQLCGEGPDGTLTDGQRSALEGALMNYFNDEAGCDPRCDEAFFGVTIHEFIGGGDCFDGTHAAQVGAQGAHTQDTHGRRRNLEEQEADVGRQLLRRAQELPAEDTPPPPAAAADPPKRTATKNRYGQRKRRSAMRASRKYRCTRCRKRKNGLASDSDRALLGSSSSPPEFLFGNDSPDTTRLSSPASSHEYMYEDQEEESDQEDDTEEEVGRFLRDDDACPADLVGSIVAMSFEYVVEATIMEIRVLDCSPGTDSCRNDDGRCCGVVNYAGDVVTERCACPVTDPPTDAPSEDPSASPSSSPTTAEPTSSPTAVCIDQGYAVENPEGRDGFELRQELMIGGLCGDGRGGLTESQRADVGRMLLEYGNQMLKEGGCASDGVKITDVAITGFREAAWCRDGSGLASAAAANNGVVRRTLQDDGAGGGKDQGSVVEVVARGTCSGTCCILEFPTPTSAAKAKPTELPTATPTAQPTVACLQQPYTVPRGSDSTFRLEEGLQLGGMCGDGQGNLPPGRREEIQSWLLEYSNALLGNGGGCSAEGVRSTGVTVVGFREAEWCQTPGAKPKDAKDGSSVEVVLEGTCGRTACLRAFPF